MKKEIWFVISFLAILSNSIAQRAEEVYLLSQKDYTTSARYLGMGKSFGALGADASSVQLNPAGLASYMRNDFSLTMSYYLNNTTTDYYNNTNSSSNGNVSFDNFSYTAYLPGKENSAIEQAAFNFSYNKSNNYNYSYSYGGDDLATSLLDYYLCDLTCYGIVSTDDIYDFYPYTAGLAYYIYLIDSYEQDGELNYFSYTESNNTNQKGKIEYLGGSADYSMSYAVKTTSGLKIGLTANLSTLHLTTNRTHFESVVDDLNDNPLNNFTRTESLEQRGTSFNAKLGFIYDVSDFIRIGGGIHSASSTAIQEDYIVNMSAHFTDTLPSNTMDYVGYKYKIKTPWAYLLNFALIRGKNGLITVDYKMTDYTTMGLKDKIDPTYFDGENEYIKSQYTLSHQINAGSEFRHGNFTARFGGGVTTPGEKGVGYTFENWMASLGAGYRSAKYAFDLAYVYAQNQSTIYPYGLEYDQTATTQGSQNRIILTVSFK